MSTRHCPDHPSAGYTPVDAWGRTCCEVCDRTLAWYEVTDPAVLRVNPTINQGGRPACAHCGQTESVQLVRTVQMNCESLVYWWCHACERRTVKSSGLNYKHPDVLRYLAYVRVRWPNRQHPAGIDDVPVLFDNRTQEPCAVCGEHGGVEYHHFMPQAFRNHLDVAPYWQAWDKQGAYLCRDHHVLWHKLVAPMHMLAGVPK